MPAGLIPCDAPLYLWLSPLRGQLGLPPRQLQEVVPRCRANQTKLHTTEVKRHTSQSYRHCIATANQTVAHATVVHGQSQQYRSTDVARVLPHLRLERSGRLLHLGVAPPGWVFVLYSVGIAVASGASCPVVNPYLRNVLSTKLPLLMLAASPSGAGGEKCSFGIDDEPAAILVKSRVIISMALCENVADSHPSAASWKTLIHWGALMNEQAYTH